MNPRTNFKLQRASLARKTVVYAALITLSCFAAVGLRAQTLMRPSADRGDPALDYEHEEMSQGGPWRARPTGALESSDAEFMRLLNAYQWTQAREWLKQKQPQVNIKDALGATPLSLAAQAGYLPLVQDLIARGANVNELGVDGLSPLAAAAYQGHKLVVQELLRKGADPRQFTATGQTALHLASQTGRSGIVSLLLQTDPSLLRVFNAQGLHALAEAAKYGQLRVMKTLVDAGLAADTPCRFGVNAIHYAALGRQPEAVDWLKAHGAKVNSPLTALLLEKMTEPLPSYDDN